MKDNSKIRHAAMKDFVTIVCFLVFSLGLAICFDLNETFATHAAAASDETLQSIKSKGVIRIATNPGIEPMEYRQDWRLVGYDFDFGNELAKRLHVKAEWVVYDTLEDLVERIVQGGDHTSYDVAISALGIDVKRTKNSIAVPYFKSGLTILTTRSDRKTVSLDELVGKRIAAVSGSTEYDIAKRIKDMTMFPVRTYRDSVSALLDGSVDAAVMDVPIALVAAKRNSGDLRVVSRPSRRNGTGFIWRRPQSHCFGPSAWRCGRCGRTAP